MTASQMYVETANGRKIAVMDIEDCIISVQTSSGKEILRLQSADFSMHTAIAKFHAELTELHGSFMSASKIAEITADIFDVHPSHVRRCVLRSYQESQMVKNAA